MNDLVSRFALSFLLWFVDGAYGKFSSALAFPPFVDGKIGWLVQEAVSPIVFTLACFFPCASSPRTPWTTPKSILVGLWLVHYINRSFIYTYRAPRMAPSHLITVLSAIVFNIVNGYVNGRWIGVWGAYPEDQLTSPRFWTGVFVWGVGMAINVHHDNILFRLRRESSAKQASDDIKSRYIVPHDGLFRYITCPTYFGEIIEWIGFSIAAWYSPGAVAFVIGTISNLVPRAWRTHKWYHNKFKDEYPKDRKVIIPGVF